MIDFRSVIRDLERSLAKAIQGRDCCLGLSLAQCHLLLEIANDNAASVKNLSERLDLDKSTLSRTVDQLVRNGMIERREDPHDRRGMRVTLTKEGEKTAGSVNARCDRFYRSLLARIPREKQAGVISAFEILTDAFQQELTDDCCLRPATGKKNGTSI